MNKDNPAANANRDINLLFVDDDINFLDALRRLFERLGYMVASASNKEQAIALIKYFIFDVVITDCSMPGINGIQLVVEVKNLLKDTPVILYTGQMDIFDERKIADTGITEIVRKPLQIRDLEIVIKRVLRQNQEAKPMNKEIPERIYKKEDIDRAFDMGMNTALSVFERSIGLSKDNQQLILQSIKDMILENRAAAVSGRPLAG